MAAAATRVVVHAAVRNLSQLAKIDPELATTLTEPLLQIALRRGAEWAATTRGGMHCAFPAERGGSVAALRAAVQLEQELERYAERLFGHAVLLSTDGEEAAMPIVAQTARRMSGAIDRAGVSGAGGVFADGAAAPLLATAGHWRPHGALWRLVAVAPAGVSEADASARDWFWCRRQDLSRILDAVEQRLNTGAGLGAVVVAGTDRSAVRRYLQRAAAELVGDEGEKRMPWLGVLPGRKSPVHPFLNLLGDAELDRVAPFLSGAELAIWNEVAPVVAALTGAKAPAGDVAGASYPDCAFQELVAASQLLLLAGARERGAAGLPAPIVCLDVDQYHPAALRALVRGLRDLLQLPQSIVLLSVASALPRELGALKPRHVTLRPLSRAATQQLISERHRGAVVPARVVDQLTLLTAGRLRRMQLYLRYLEGCGKLQRTADGWRWVTRRSLAASLPASVDGAAWRVAQALPEVQREALLVAQLGAGLLRTEHMAQLLVTSGHAVDEVPGTLHAIAEVGLADAWPQMVGAFPRLIPRLQESLGPRGQQLSRQLREMMLALWRRGDLTNHVMLFMHLSRHDDPSPAPGALFAAVQRRLEEAAAPAAAQLLDPRHISRIRDRLAPAERAALDFFVAVMEERARRESALIGDTSAASAGRRPAAHGSAPWADAAPTPELAALLLSSRTRAELQAGDTDGALATAKESLSANQQALARGPESPDPEEAYVDLAAAMLAAGKLEEAVGYLRFAYNDSGRGRPYLVRAAALQAVAALLAVKLDEAMSLARAGRELAVRSARRGWEAMFCFLMGRVSQATGDYRAAVMAYQQCLAVCEVFDLEPAAAVANRWVARAFTFAGQPHLAIRQLQALDAGGGAGELERALFLAEAFYLAGDRAAARPLLATVRTEWRVARFPAEGPSWETGFASVEGYCHRLAVRSAPRYAELLEMLIGAELAERQPLSAWERIEQLGREEQLGLDPSLVSLHAILARVSAAQSGRGSGDDHALIIGRGVAHLRERAARILAPKERTDYLENEYWNAFLTGEARRMRLL